MVAEQDRRLPAAIGAQALIDQLFDLAQVTPAYLVMDLGSGNGRTVITALKRGTRAVGGRSRRSRRRANVHPIAARIC